MMDRNEFWGRSFASAVERYGEERAAQVADRALTEFDKRFGQSSAATLPDTAVTQVTPDTLKAMSTPAPAPTPATNK